MTRFITAIAAMATLVAAPAFASDPAKKQASTDSMTQRICVVSKTTGSILERKECRTRGEWIAQTGVDPSKQTKK